jgi:hypothetical protein
LVALLPNQPLSGTVTLDDIARQGARFEWGGDWYMQKEVGENLARSWDVIIGGQKLGRTLLLRRAT